MINFYIKEKVFVKLFRNRHLFNCLFKYYLEKRRSYFNKDSSLIGNTLIASTRKNNSITIENISRFETKGSLNAPQVNISQAVLEDVFTRRLNSFNWAVLINLIDIASSKKKITNFDYTIVLNGYKISYLFGNNMLTIKSIKKI